MSPRNDTFLALALASALLASGAFACGGKRAPQAGCPDERVLVQVAYPGASPTEVEQGVLTALEEAVRGRTGVRGIRSIARDGQATVTVQLAPGRSADAAVADIAAAVRGLTTLPESAEEPQVVRAQPLRERLVVAVSSPAHLSDLLPLADRLRDQLLTLPAVADVTFLARPGKRIEIAPMRDKLREYGITLDQVAQAVRQRSVTVPGGTLATDRGEVLGRANAPEADDPEALGELVLGPANVRLGDLADIELELERPLYTNVNGRNALILLVTARAASKSDTSALDDIRALVSQHMLPPETRFQVIGTSPATTCHPAGPAGLLPPLEGVISIRGYLPPGGDFSAQRAVRDRLSNAAWAAAGERTIQILSTQVPGSSEMAAHLGHTESADRPVAEVAVLLPEDADASDRSAVLASLRDHLAAAPPGFQVSIQGPRLTALVARVMHPDLQVLQRAATTLAESLAREPRVLSATPLGASNRPSVSISLGDRGRMYGGTETAMARTLRQAVLGIEVSRFQRGSDEVSVMVRATPYGRRPHRLSLRDLRYVRVPTADGREVPLDALASIELRREPAAIHRFDGRRGIQVVISVTQEDAQDLARKLRRQISRGVFTTQPDVAIELDR